MNKKDDWIREADKKIIQYLWIILVSIVTSLITVYLKMH